MSIFTKKVINHNVNVNALIDKAMENNFYIEFLKRVIKEAIDIAIENLQTRIKNNDVQYNWYGHLRDYSISLKLSDVVDILKEYYLDDLTAFYTLSDEYLQKNEEYQRKKDEEQKAEVNN